MTLHVVSQDDMAAQRLRDILADTVPGSGKINWHVASAFLFCFLCFGCTLRGLYDFAHWAYVMLAGV